MAPKHQSVRIALRKSAESHLRQVLKETRLDARIELVWAGPRRMAALNKRYRSVDGPTDVISFPLYSYKELRSKNSPRQSAGDPAAAGQELEKVPNTQYAIRDTPPVLLGTLVLCQSEIIRRAKSSGQTPAAYVEWALSHGVKHLLGYDHDGSGERWFPKYTPKKNFARLSS